MTVDLQSSNSPEDMDRREILADVNVACRTTLDILNDLLCFDKMESGILVLHRHEVPVLSFISDCVSMFSAQAREGDVTMSYTNCGGEDALDLCSLASASSLIERDTVFIDRFKMDQVLRNLISNALKFTPRGGTVNVISTFVPDQRALQMEHSTARSLLSINKSTQVVTVQALPVQESSVQSSGINGSVSPVSRRRGSLSMKVPKNRIHVSCDPDSPVSTKGRLVIIVKDTGSGMIEKDYSRLFKEIVQFNPEVLQAGGGSGLGLWITKGIVDLHQGQISVHSDGLGCGSSFTVELPMERTSKPRSIKRPRCESKEDSFKLAVRHSSASNIFELTAEYVPCSKPVHTLLIVDDSPLNRKMLLRTFRGAGHTCEEAEDGVICVAKVKEMMSSSAKAYSAILMDFVMPNMDGPTATKEIRSLGYTGLIFGVTGNTLEADIDYFIDSGANQVLAKPLDMDVFDIAMRRN